MKTNEPKIIYLQIGEDVEVNELKDYEFETNAITWCWERIFDNDIEYISKQSIIGLIDEMIGKYKEEQHDFANPSYEHDTHDGRIWALQELKQKIEQLDKGE